MTNNLVQCAYDKCCSFEPSTANHKYCVEHRCKRKEENRRKRLEKPLVYDASVFQMEENRKIALIDRREEKNRWILENKSFAFFDLETTDLDADGEEILCGCIKPRGEPVRTFVSDGLKMGNDTRVVQDIRNALQSYDYIVTWFGTKFDMPFLTTRLLLTGGEPIGYARHLDLYYTSRFSLKLHSNRLESVSEALFEGKTLKTRLSKPIWKWAVGFDRKKREKAYNYIIDHCERDVEELENIFEELYPLRNISATPLRKY